MTETNFSYELEMSTLGSALLSDRAAAEICEIVKPSDFYRPSHRLIMAAISELVSKGEAVDLETLRDRLKAKGNYAHVGGEDYLIQVAEFVPSPANSGTYARQIKEKSWRRESREQLVRLCEEFGDEDFDADDLAVKLASLGDNALKGLTGRFIRPQDIDFSGPSRKGVRTGYGPKIDGFTQVGYVSGQVTVIAATAKGGKSTWMIGSAIHAVREGKKVFYAVFADLSPRELMFRIVRQMCGWEEKPWGKAEVEKWDAAWEEINDPYGGWQTNFQIYDATEKGNDIESFTVQFMAEHFRNPQEVLFMDYLQEIESTSKQAMKGQTATIEIVGSKCAKLAKKADIPIVIGSQVTQDSNGKLTTKYATATQEKAAWVLFLHREDHANEATVLCAYNRFGEQKTKTTLPWNKTRVAFCE